MTRTRAVAYTATPGYLFQTILSAVQARRNVDDATQVHVAALVEPGAAESELDGRQRPSPSAHGIRVQRVASGVLEGLHPMFGRLFLDRVLPEAIDTVLYLDGDTQVRGPLTPLLDKPLARGRLAAVIDPMSAVRRTHRGLGRRIDRGWDAAGLPPQARQGYVNSGVLMFHRADLASFRERVLAANADHGATFTHADQDAINYALWDVIDHVELEWNYPAFLLGVDWKARDDARVVHFMSNPRPWHGSYLPWRREGYRPYADLVRRHPELSPYWGRPALPRALRNHAQQVYKACSEGRHWRSARFRAALEAVYPGRLDGAAAGEGRALGAAPIGSVGSA